MFNVLTQYIILGTARTSSYANKQTAHFARVAYPFKLFYDPRINHRTFFFKRDLACRPVVCSPCSMLELTETKSSSSSYNISIILLCIIIVPSACECCVPRMLVACCLLCGKRKRSFNLSSRAAY